MVHSGKQKKLAFNLVELLIQVKKDVRGRCFAQTNVKLAFVCLFVCLFDSLFGACFAWAIELH